MPNCSATATPICVSSRWKSDSPGSLGLVGRRGCQIDTHIDGVAHVVVVANGHGGVFEGGQRVAGLHRWPRTAVTPMVLHQNVIGGLNLRMLMGNNESDVAKRHGTVKRPADTLRVLTASTRPSRLCRTRYRDHWSRPAGESRRRWQRGASPDRPLWQVGGFGPNHCAGRDLYPYRLHRRQPIPRFTRYPPAA